MGLRCFVAFLEVSGGFSVDLDASGGLRGFQGAFLGFCYC